MPGDSHESSARAIAERAARAAGKVLLRYFSEDIAFERKADESVVSRADREAEEAIRAIIGAAFPSHAFHGEEGGRRGEAGFVWYVDPLDGTTNFMHEIPLCAVSIGLEQDGRFVLGVVYDPFGDELYAAEDGRGALCNGKPIKAGEGGIVTIDASFRGAVESRKMRFLQGVLDLGLKPQIIGSNVLQLCEVARGRCAGSLSDTVSAWDFAAGVVLVREAGGVATDQNGNEPTPDSKVIVAASSRELHSRLLAIARREYEGYAGR